MAKLRPRNASIQAPIAGFGPVCSPELRVAGLDSVERIRELGWEEAFLRWVEYFPARVNVNAAYGMMAAERGVSWLTLSEPERAEARRVVGRLRKRRGPAR